MCMRLLTGEVLTMRMICLNTFPSSNPPKCTTPGSIARNALAPILLKTPASKDVA